MSPDPLYSDYMYDKALDNWYDRLLEEFEEAAMLKREVDNIHSKVEKVKSMKKPGITTGEYFKIFSVS